jgi:mono/diheme cytochrome c family protein
MAGVLRSKLDTESPKKFGLVHILGAVFISASIVLFMFLKFVVQDSTQVIQQGRPLTKAHIEVAMASEAVIKRGHLIYSTQCSSCHGSRGQGLGNAPSVVQLSSVSDFERLYQMISVGNEEKGMPSWQKMIQADDIVAVTAYIKRVLEPAPRPL